jgi:hypothetical protein
MASPPSRPAWVQEFQTFIMRGNVVDMAVGIIIGAAFTTTVQIRGPARSNPRPAGQPGLNPAEHTA